VAAAALRLLVVRVAQLQAAPLTLRAPQVPMEELTAQGVLAQVGQQAVITLERSTVRLRVAAVVVVVVPHRVLPPAGVGAAKFRLLTPKR
jgi:hypothetical protein